jgi:cyclopropane fatty-acyl-phospholipid synthase-like methyltransferase
MARGKMKGDPVYRRILPHLEGAHTLLDLGCGEGYLLSLARTHTPDVQLHGIDHDGARLDLARQVLEGEPNVTLEEQDLQSAELPGADVISCLDVLHYLVPEGQDQVIQRMCAALTENGVLVIREGISDGGWRTTVTRASEQIARVIGRHKGDGIHFRPRTALGEVLEENGMQVLLEPCSEGTPFANLLWTARKAAP